MKTHSCNTCFSRLGGGGLELSGGEPQVVPPAKGGLAWLVIGDYGHDISRAYMNPNAHV